MLQALAAFNVLSADDVTDLLALVGTTVSRAVELGIVNEGTNLLIGHVAQAKAIRPRDIA